MITEYNYEDLKKLHKQYRKDNMPSRRFCTRTHEMDKEQFDMICKYSSKAKERYKYTITYDD